MNEWVRTIKTIHASRWALAMILLFAFSAPGYAGTNDQGGPDRRALLEQAQAEFDRATELANQRPTEAAAAYRESAALFEALIATGVENGKLYYNLGNAYLQLGEIGKAILNYRRAEALIGNDAQLQANLRFARSLRRNQISGSGGKAALHTIFFWHYETTYGTRFWIAFAAYILFWAALVGRSIRRGAGFGVAASVLLVVWLVAGASVAVESYDRATTRAGVTTADDIVVRKGNGDGYDRQFEETLQPGVEFVVIDQRPGWYKVELPDGSEGWLRQSEAEII